MTVISFSTDEKTKSELEALAKAEKRSKSDIFRDMYKTYTLNQKLVKIQKVGQRKFMALGIESIDQAEEFLG